ncbi:MAG TPA: PaaI family thioesterase [Thermomicrobiales bacterium]|nr:PaaI family thioesterase [Thermomicrobiales bacterium]
MRPELSTVEALNAWSPGSLVELLGISIVSVEEGRLTSELAVRPDLMAPNGYLHAATIVAIADTTAGFGSRAHLPDGALGFTTIELKSNFLGTARDGMVECEARLVHGGRTTQVWDATVTHRDSGKTLALFRCTQMILYPSRG